MWAQSGIAVDGRVQRPGKRGIHRGGVARDHKRGCVGIGRPGGGVGLDKEGEVFVESKAADVEPETVGEIELSFKFCERFDRRVKFVVSREPVVDGVDLGERNLVKLLELTGRKMGYGENPAAFECADAEATTETGAAGMIGRTEAVGITIVGGDQQVAERDQRINLNGREDG